MSISAAAAAALPAVVSKTPSSTIPNLARFSSLHFPPKLRIAGIRNNSLKHKPPYRTFTLFASKKQTYSSFDELLEKSDKPILVDFYATWCGPCQFMVPILEQVSAAIGDKVGIVKIDTEKYPDIANKYSIEALPTFILFKDGEPFDRFEGAMGAEQLIQRIETSLQAKQ